MSKETKKKNQYENQEIDTKNTDLLSSSNRGELIKEVSQKV